MRMWKTADLKAEKYGVERIIQIGVMQLDKKQNIQTKTTNQSKKAHKEPALVNLVRNVIVWAAEIPFNYVRIVMCLSMLPMSCFRRTAE